MFMTYQKKIQTQYLARTWQKSIRQREVERNNYHVTGDLKKAKNFVILVSNYTFPSEPRATFEQLIFSCEKLAVPLGLVYAFEY